MQPLELNPYPDAHESQALLLLVLQVTQLLSTD